MNKTKYLIIYFNWRPSTMRYLQICQAFISTTMKNKTVRAQRVAITVQPPPFSVSL